MNKSSKSQLQKTKKSEYGYTVQQLADLAKVSVRTLHYYDEVGLLRPSYTKPNGYRYYNEKELLLLQQILFFRELEFPLEEIKQIINSPNFNLVDALKDQKKLIETKRKRLTGLLATINKTMNKIQNKKQMEDKELFGGLDKKQMEEYQAEAKERWGNTDAWKQSQERVRKMSKEDMKKIQDAGNVLMEKMTVLMNTGKKADDTEVQKLVAEHYNGLRHFYEPNPVMYKGLGDMYVSDQRFTAYYDKFHIGLAVFLRDGMHVYAGNLVGQAQK